MWNPHRVVVIFHYNVQQRSINDLFYLTAGMADAEEITETFGNCIL